MSHTKFLLVREIWSHMTSVSGFDPLFTELEPHLEGCVSNCFVPSSLDATANVLSRAWRRVQNRYQGWRGIRETHQNPSPFVRREHEILAENVIRKASKEESWIIFSVGENQLAAAAWHAPLSVRKRIIVCFHQPPSWFRLHWRASLDLGFAAVVCLSEEQRAFFETNCSSPVIKTRHGVNHGFFRPAQARNTGRGARLLFVGYWLRDFITLIRAMEVIWSELPETRLDCIVPWGARNNPELIKLARDERTKWHADLTSQQLRDMYQASDLLFIPLIDSTANNSIVEALASGVPVVSTHLGGTPEYVSRTAGTLCPAGDPDAHARAALQLLSNPELREQVGLAGREYAQTALDWPRIAEELAEELNTIVDRYNRHNRNQR